MRSRRCLCSRRRFGRSLLAQRASALKPHVRVELPGSDLDAALELPAVRVDERGDMLPGQPVKVSLGDAEQGDEPVGRRFAEEHGVVAAHKTAVDRQ